MVPLATGIDCGDGRCDNGHSDLSFVYPLLPFFWLPGLRGVCSCVGRHDLASRLGSLGWSSKSNVWIYCRPRLIKQKWRTKTSPAGLQGLILDIWPIRGSAFSYLIFVFVFCFWFSLQTERFVFLLFVFALNRYVRTAPEIEVKPVMYRLWRPWPIGWDW